MSESVDAKAKAAKATFVEIVSDAVNEYHASGVEAPQIADDLILCIEAIIEKSTKPNINRVLVCYILQQHWDNTMRHLVETCIKE